MCLWNTLVWLHMNLVSACVRSRSLWLSKAVLWSIKERPLCWAWEWHFIDIKNNLIAKWFGFDPAVKRLERPEAKHSVIKIKERKTGSFLTLIMQFWKPWTTKEENCMVILFNFVLLYIFPKDFLLLFFSSVIFNFWFFFRCINPKEHFFFKWRKIWQNTAKKK